MKFKKGRPSRGLTNVVSAVENRPFDIFLINFNCTHKKLYVGAAKEAIGFSR